MENSNNTFKILAAALVGAAIGGALGILYAPAKGKKTRKKIMSKGEHVKDSIVEKFSELKDTLQKETEDLKEVINGSFKQDSSKA